MGAALSFFISNDWLNPMPRKPNYRFERNEREKAKAAKKAAKTEAKAQKKSDPSEDGDAGDERLAEVDSSER
jgi:hypothetical protein